MSEIMITGDEREVAGDRPGSVAMHVLPAGSRFDPKSGKATLPVKR